MNNQTTAQSNTGCVLNAVIIMLLIVIAFGVFGGALAVEGIAQRQVTIYPDIPAPAPAQLNYVPSAQTFTEPATSDCPDPSLPFAGWEDGVGGVLPPCWTREQQNAYMRRH